MRLVQFELRNGERRVGVVDGTTLREVRTARSVRELALAAIEAGVGLAQQVDSLGLGGSYDYATLLAELKILRNGEVIWRNEFLSGEANMCHSLENLEYHHFKYRQFLKPGDVHIHFFGTATLSSADGIRTQAGDVFEISQAEFGAPLVNRVGSSDAAFEPGNVISL